MAVVSNEDFRALAWGYKAMHAEAVAALLRIVNECESMSACQRAAQEALDALGEPE